MDDLEVIELGRSLKDGSSVTLTIDERRQGTYIIGTTGTGKSNLLKHIVYQDMDQDEKHGLCVLDPHGDLIDDLLKIVPEKRINDVILFDPADFEYPFGLNLLDCDRDDPQQVTWVVSTIIGTLERLSTSWGPRLEHVLRHSLMTIMELKESTFLELTLLLTNESYREPTLANIKDDYLKEFWKGFPRSERLRYELTSSTLNKISPFITDRNMRNIIGQSHNSFNMKEIMDEGKILLVNLSKGDLGEANSSILGAVLINSILMAALQRRDKPLKKRIPFHIIADEYQNFATESFAVLQSEARKYAVDVVVAHQFRDQLDYLNKGSTLNVGNIIIFRVTGRDSYELASQFDNTPPSADTRVEPVYRGYEYQGLDLFIETKLNTGEGKLYQEIELPRRPYNDVEAERANQLSIQSDYQASTRLIYVPDSRNEEGSPYLIEHNFKTINFEEDIDLDDALVEEKIRQIKEISHTKGTPREIIEKDIKRRTFGQIDTDFDIPAAEKI
ncbi:type IV secretory system conjugative DNA transfer family protein [Chloroflexota bacterium]